jgi:hypothetical protein
MGGGVVLVLPLQPEWTRLIAINRATETGAESFNGSSLGNMRDLIHIINDG